jgi:hypothetical protein
MKILDIVQTWQREPDRIARNIPSIAMVAISRCEGFVLRYDFSIVYAGRPLSQCRSGLRRARSAKYRRRRTLTRFVVGLPSRSSPRLYPQGQKRPPSPRLRRDSLRSPVRRERRLEARGFEPLTSSLQSWRSTN